MVAINLDNAFNITFSISVRSPVIHLMRHIKHLGKQLVFYDYTHTQNPYSHTLYLTMNMNPQ